MSSIVLEKTLWNNTAIMHGEFSQLCTVSIVHGVSIVHIYRNRSFHMNSWNLPIKSSFLNVKCHVKCLLVHNVLLVHTISPVHIVSILHKCGKQCTSHLCTNAANSAQFPVHNIWPCTMSHLCTNMANSAQFFIETFFKMDYS